MPYSKKVLPAIAVAVFAAAFLPLQGLWNGGRAEAHGGKGHASILTGPYVTDGLVGNASQWFVEGASQQQIMREVYAPFIIGGKATWSNTWGAARYGPAPGQRRSHEGQDVFCEYGDPVLASESGTIEFESQSVGGLVARLHRPDGSYWYYAHVSGFNDAFSTGDAVAPGDIIAYCGNSGNAASTPPHVHFGWYDASGNALDPMRPLVRWLKAAMADSTAPNVKTPKHKEPKRARPSKVKGSTTGTTAVLKLDIRADTSGDPRAQLLRKTTKRAKTVTTSKAKATARPVIARVEKLLD